MNIKIFLLCLLFMTYNLCGMEESSLVAEPYHCTKSGRSKSRVYDDKMFVLKNEKKIITTKNKNILTNIPKNEVSDPNFINNDFDKLFEEIDDIWMGIDTNEVLMEQQLKELTEQESEKTRAKKKKDEENFHKLNLKDMLVHHQLTKGALVEKKSFVIDTSDELKKAIRY